MEQRGQERRGRFLMASETYRFLIAYEAPPGDAQVLLRMYQLGEWEEAVACGFIAVLYPVMLLKAGGVLPGAQEL